MPQVMLLMQGLQLVVMLPIAMAQHLLQLLFSLAPDSLIQGHQLSNTLLLGQHHLHAALAAMLHVTLADSNVADDYLSGG
jgi:hypothetical protein